MKLSEIMKDVPVLEWHADPEMEIAGVEADSRRAGPGCLFVAVVGYETDGHGYIPAAAEKGAACVLCSRAPETDIPYVLTDNTRRGLALTAANWYGRPAEKMKIVGVTGTNGKTTTTNLIKTILEKTTGKTVGMIGTNGNYIGSTLLPTERTTPESNELQELFARMAEAGCSYVVMEVSSHALYLDRVCGVPFEVGVFTNLTEDHLDFHKTMDEYARAKALLFRQSEKGGVNLDDPYAQVMLSGAACPMLTWSIQKNEADLVAKDVRLASDGVRFCALSAEGLARVKLAIPGRFSVYNALTVIACGLQLGIPLEKCCEALSDAVGVKGRMEVVPTDGDYTILIDYAHTPDALENVLRALRETTSGRLVALFGCGGDRDRTKRPIMGKIATETADFTIITSDNPRTEEPKDIIADILEGVSCPKSRYRVIVDHREAIAWAIDNHKSGDVIVLAGKGHETYQIVGKTKHHMDEREIVAEHLAARAQA